MALQRNVQSIYSRFSCLPIRLYIYIPCVHFNIIVHFSVYLFITSSTVAAYLLNSAQYIHVAYRTAFLECTYMYEYVLVHSVQMEEDDEEYCFMTRRAWFGIHKTKLVWVIKSSVILRELSHVLMSVCRIDGFFCTVKQIETASFYACFPNDISSIYDCFNYKCECDFIVCTFCCLYMHTPEKCSSI